MRQYGFREDAQRLLLDNCVFEMADPGSIRGGGFCRFGYDGERTVVHLDTAQHEAAVHEMAHAWWFLIEVGNQARKDLLVNRLLEYFLKQADATPGRFALVRNHCRIYKYGEGDFPGMWMDHRERWNHDEIFAGLASSVMGDVRQMPADLRRIFRHCFWDEFVYFPGVQA